MEISELPTSSESDEEAGDDSKDFQAELRILRAQAEGYEPMIKTSF